MDLLTTYCVRHLERKGWTLIPPGQPLQPVVDPPEPESNVVFDSVEKQVLDMINRYRRANNRARLLHNSQLQASSEAHSREMAQAGVMAHQLPGEPAPDKRASNAGYKLRAFAENIAMGAHGTAQEVFGLWKNSPPHNAAMLSHSYTEAGVAMVKAKGQYWWTLNLGRR